MKTELSRTAEVASNLSPIGDIPTRESQARPLGSRLTSNGKHGQRPRSHRPMASRRRLTWRARCGSFSPTGRLCGSPGRSAANGSNGSGLGETSDG